MQCCTRCKFSYNMCFYWLKEQNGAGEVKASKTTKQAKSLKMKAAVSTQLLRFLCL